MHRLPAISLLVPVAILCLGVLLAEGWWLWRAHEEAVREMETLGRLRQERDWLANQAPSLNAENEAALVAEVALAGRVRDELRQALAGKDSAAPAAPPPAGSTEAFFELAGFVADIRARAGQANVQLKADECFGFAAYTNAGPAAADIGAVHRQRLDTELLVGRLLEARPLALLAVRREQPAGSGPPDPREHADDYFALDSPLSVRRPGEVEGEAYQLVFTGQTEALRKFLNALATGPLPVWARSVQVEPLAPPLNPSRLAPPGLLVAPAVSKFTVVVELIRLADNPGTTVP